MIPFTFVRDYEPVTKIQMPRLVRAAIKECVPFRRSGILFASIKWRLFSSCYGISDAEVDAEHYLSSKWWRIAIGIGAGEIKDFRVNLFRVDQSRVTRLSVYQIPIGRFPGGIIQSVTPFAIDTACFDGSNDILSPLPSWARR